MKKIIVKTILIILAFLVITFITGTASYFIGTIPKIDYFSYMKNFYTFFLQAIAVMVPTSLLVYGVIHLSFKIYGKIIKE